MKNVNEQNKFVYDAFVSYTRKDEKFAKKLENDLEKYRAPKGLGIKRRINVFRDIFFAY